MFKIIVNSLSRKNLIFSSPHYLLVFQKKLIEIKKPVLPSNKKKSSTVLIQKYAISFYTNFMKNKYLEIINLYRIFQTGIKNFYEDFKQYLQLQRKIRKYGLDILTQKELYLIIIMSKDLKKIIPIILISIVPFTNYIIIPLAFYFPHKFLTSHFWTIQEKRNFILNDHKNRLKHNKSLLQCMERTVNVIRDKKLSITLSRIIENLNNGTHPIMDDIIICKKLFSEPPFSLDYINRKHVQEVLKVHGMSQFSLRNRSKLFQRGLIIKQWDIIIEREGGVKQLSDDAIQWALSFRGLNPINMSIYNMQIWLNQWLLISSHVNAENISLLLHCPILLAYNHKNNIILYDQKKSDQCSAVPSLEHTSNKIVLIL